MLVEQEIEDILRNWQDYISCISREFADRSICQKIVIHPRERSASKLFIEIIYLLDYLVTRRHSEFLSRESFKLPILISLYLLTSITVGDVHLKQNYLWPCFERFVSVYEMLPEEELGRLKGEATRLFVEVRVIEALAKIPLDLKL